MKEQGKKTKPKERYIETTIIILLLLTLAYMVYLYPIALDQQRVINLGIYNYYENQIKNIPTWAIEQFNNQTILVYLLIVSYLCLKIIQYNERRIRNERKEKKTI
jgi:uncharacterized membrane protein YukC